MIAASRFAAKGNLLARTAGSASARSASAKKYQPCAKRESQAVQSSAPHQNIKGSGADGPYDCRTHRVPNH
jgi:hypothetical protein